MCNSEPAAIRVFPGESGDEWVAVDATGETDSDNPDGVRYVHQSVVAEMRWLIDRMYKIIPGQPGCGDMSRMQNTFADIQRWKAGHPDDTAH